MEHEGEVGLRLGGQHPSRGEPRIVDEGGVPISHPAHRVGRIGYDGIERLLVAKLRIEQRVAQRDVELIVVHIVQEHVHPRQVVGGVVDLLPEESFLYLVRIKLLLRLQEERPRATRRVVDLVHLPKPMQSQLRNELGDILGGEELAARFPRIRRVV